MEGLSAYFGTEVDNTECDTGLSELVIGPRNFLRCLVLTRVDVPKSVTEIRYAAFGACANLKWFKGPGVKTLSDRAFAYCKNLITVDVPVATHLGANAFDGCVSMIAINGPCVTHLGSEAFYNCKSIKTIYFPLCTDFGERSFQDCKELMMFHCNKKIRVFRRCVFSGAAMLQHVHVPPDCTIEPNAFAFCTSLRSISFSGPPLFIGRHAFFRGPIRREMCFIHPRRWAETTSLGWLKKQSGAHVVTHIGAMPSKWSRVQARMVATAPFLRSWLKAALLSHKKCNLPTIPAELWLFISELCEF